MATSPNPYIIMKVFFMASIMLIMLASCRTRAVHYCPFKYCHYVGQKKMKFPKWENREAKPYDKLHFKHPTFSYDELDSLLNPSLYANKNDSALNRLGPR
jgi:hypothetical protein